MIQMSISASIKCQNLTSSILGNSVKDIHGHCAVFSPTSSSPSLVWSGNWVGVFLVAPHPIYGELIAAYLGPDSPVWPHPAATDLLRQPGPQPASPWKAF